MVFNALNDLLGVELNLEKLEKIIMERFESYSSVTCLQYDAEGCFHHRVAYLVLSMIAIDFPQFKYIFFEGESKLLGKSVENKVGIEKEDVLMSLLQYLTHLLQKGEHKKLNEKELNYFRLVILTLKNICKHSEHIFSESHTLDCQTIKFVLPFNFLYNFVAKREVEVKEGKVYLDCGQWKKILEIIFYHIPKLELSLLENSEELREAIKNSEDDRIRQIMKRFLNMLTGNMCKNTVPIKSIDLDSQYFPPCMANLHQILKRTHRLSYDSRYQYTLFLKDIGVSVEDNISFWRGEYSKPCNGSKCSHDWDEKKTRYLYQIQHAYGLIGNRDFKCSHSCKKFIRNLETKMDGGCPFQHFPIEHLRKSIPKAIMEIPDVEDIFFYKSQKLPQKACAAYLSCQRKVWLQRKFSQDEVKRVPFIISPLHFYMLAKNIASS